MRLLHTSDWHLGQSFHNFERTWEHQCFLDWLLDTIVAEQADALLVAGDIFDSANPSAASQRQFYRFLQQARQRAPKLEMIIIAGNHDAPARLEAPQPLLDDSGATIVGTVPRHADGTPDFSRLVLPLHDAQGDLKAWCIALPFLRPADLPRCEGDPYVDGITLLYSQAYDYAKTLAQAGQAIIAMGHCHMVDGSTSLESERRLVIGGSEALPPKVFGPDIAYAALGHLHMAQRVGGRENVRYSGSPLPLSFSELNYQHQVLRIELDGASAAVSSIPVPRAVELLRVPSQPAALDEVLAALAALDLPPSEPHAQPYLEARVLVDKPEPGLRSRIEVALAGKPVRLTRIDLARRGAAPELAPALSLDQLQQLQPDEIFRRLYRQRFDADAPQEQLQAFAELLLGEEH